MNIIFNISYSTVFGEEVVLNMLNEHGAATPYRMRTTDGKLWTCTLDLNKNVGSHVLYYYTIVRGEDNIIKKEWTVKPHRLELNVPQSRNFFVNDRWNNTPEDTYLYSSAFTDCIRRRRSGVIPFCGNDITLRIKVKAPQLRGDQRLILVGSDTTLGAWNTQKGVAMYEHDHNEWIADIDLKKLNVKTFEFKFVATGILSGSDVMWEDGFNRSITLPNVKENDVVVYEEDEAFFAICDVKFAGTQVPVFSLRSKESFGVGDFGDLRKMISWIAHTKQRILQILPINDTTDSYTWTDSYPYNCISVFALHPQYVDLTTLPPIADETKRKEYEKLRIELNALERIDYVRVNKAKNAYLRDLYTQEGKNTLETEDFKKFFHDNEGWLVPYAQYCFFRDKYHTTDFEQWEGHLSFDEKDRQALSNPRNSTFKKVSFYYFVQYVLASQLSAVHEHARSLGVILKGDIPIGVSRSSCDVWQERRYFNMNGQAGAPPDDFSVNGQNWGFPTYNWLEMMKDDCRWWVDRFQNMSKYFDAYRIDHILGFFRIWEIPLHSVHGLLGQFSPALGMTREEIEAYGFAFDEQAYTEPFITDNVLNNIFGDEAKEIRQTYLDPIGNGHYKLKAEFDTQRKVKNHFDHNGKPDDSITRERLYSLISDVLFVRDHRDSNRYHPRIAVQHDYIYDSLDDNGKYIFNKIYNDYFYRRNNRFWYREAMNKLPCLTEATRMLTCAEDLGMVPECVSWVMNELKILSLELQSMPKEPYIRFGNLDTFPYRSVCTISSHDTPTLRQWWDEDAARTQEYYNSKLQKYGEAPHPLPGWLSRDVILRHLKCPSMLCILTIQDWLSIDEYLRHPNPDVERINIPSNPRHYWRYRMHVCIEDLMNNNDFNQNIIDLIKEGGRMS